MSPTTAPSAVALRSDGQAPPVPGPEPRAEVPQQAHMATRITTVPTRDDRTRGSIVVTLRRKRRCDILSGDRTAAQERIPLVRRVLTRQAHRRRR